MYAMQVGYYRVLRYALALPLLPAEHMLAAFNNVTANIVDEILAHFINYVRTMWLENST